jgi:hypothetical protein
LAGARSGACAPDRTADSAAEQAEACHYAAEAALKEGEQAHKAKIDKARAALSGKLEAEEARWKKKKLRLESALRRVRPPTIAKLA